MVFSVTSSFVNHTAQRMPYTGVKQLKILTVLVVKWARPRTNKVWAMAVVINASKVNCPQVPDEISRG